MRWSIGVSLLPVLASAAAGAQTKPPGTDIYLAPLSTRDGRLEVGTPTNITNRPGYDNQPSFTPDGRAILFTSIRDDGQADIYRYDLATKAVTRVTSTPESEYSPTVMPGGKRFSVIRVERDSTQRLWSFNLDGSDPQVVFATAKPVGYHAWIGRDTAVLFLLGSGLTPNALVRMERSGQVDTLARNIGRSLVALSGRAGFSYVQRMPDSTWQLRIGDVRRPPSAATFGRVAELPPGADFVAWLSTDRVLTATGTKLMLRDMTKAGGWTDVADFGAAGLSRLSRLAVSPDGRWLAVVAEPKL
jgi:dipeptidyl aminopeptidase/acylaminoacyl peptidase